MGVQCLDYLKKSNNVDMPWWISVGLILGILKQNYMRNK